MMPRCLLILMLLGLTTGAARADSFWSDCWKCLSKPFCCPDDYCKKPLPPEYHAANGCRDNYCQKPLPPACGPVPLGCDDYHKKPWTTCPTVGSGPWYICRPGSHCPPR